MGRDDEAAEGSSRPATLARCNKRRFDFLIFWLPKMGSNAFTFTELPVPFLSVDTLRPRGDLMTYFQSKIQFVFCLIKVTDSEFKL